MRSACTGTSTERSTVPSATRCSTAFAQRTWRTTGFQAVRGSPAACRSTTRCSSSARRRWISSSVGGSSSGKATRRSAAASVTSCAPVGTWRQIAIGIAEANGICSGDVGSRLAAARARSAASARRSANSRSGPGLGVERLERDDVARAALQEDALAARPRAHALAQRADEVGRRLGHVGADHDGMRRERDDGADGAAGLVVDANHGDVAVALLVRVPAQDRAALVPLPAVDGDPLGDRAPEPEARRAGPPRRLDRGGDDEVADGIAVPDLLVVPVRVATDLRPAGCRRRRVRVL